MTCGDKICVKKRYALTRLFLNHSLEKIVIESKINTRGTVLSKSVQTFAYADDVNIIDRTLNDVKQSFMDLKRDA